MGLTKVFTVGLSYLHVRPDMSPLAAVLKKKKVIYAYVVPIEASGT